MKHLELHIIQSVPVACLNRDDLNSPKTAIFGGVQRARVSSQSWKRAIRALAKEISEEENSNLFNGDRSRRMVFTLKNRLVDRGISENPSVAIAEKVAATLEKLDSKIDTDGYKKIKTVMFFSKAEYDAIADIIAESDDVKKSITSLDEAIEALDKAGNDQETKKKATEAKEKALKAMGKTLTKGPILKAIKAVKLEDAADIALFGRMVASHPSLKVDGASMFSHILSTHKADNEIDFFTAVDDLGGDETGAGMTSTLEFNSATYYRFAALNIDELAKDDHLGDAVFSNDTTERTIDTRKEVVRVFLQAIIKAMPRAMQTSKNANTIPSYVFGVVREKGHPIQLINAFESPVRPSNKGFTVESIRRMNEEFFDLEDNWEIGSVFAKAVVKNSLKESVEDGSGKIEFCKLNELINEMVEHVI